LVCWLRRLGHVSFSDPQVAGSIPNGPGAKKIHHYLPGDQKSKDEKWSFNFIFCAVYDFVPHFLQERALYVFGK
jgi:hypothetical protein